MDAHNLDECYIKRFSKVEKHRRSRMWQTLCSFYLQKFIKRNYTVIDLGAGYCEFINNIKCKKKIAVDLNPETRLAAGSNVNVVNVDVLKLSKKFNNSVDVVFISNFLEHLRDRDEVLQVLIKANKLLKTGGILLLIQPNIDLVKNKYWDFIDHSAVLNTRSIIEVLELANFKVEVFIKRFLPYTTKNFVFTPLFLIKVYLSLPEFLRPFAGQSFVVARKI